MLTELILKKEYTKISSIYIDWSDIENVIMIGCTYLYIFF